MFVLLFWTVVVVRNIIMFQFTIVAAIMGSVALFWFITMHTTGKITIEHVVLVLFIAVTFCVRKQIFYMIVPILIFSYFVKYYKYILNNRRLPEKGFLILTLVICICLIGINKLGYSEKKWQEFRNYNSSRSSVYDYDYFPEYESNREV